MEAFARQYGFEFRCHALKHANRKAGEERSFWTVETNFLPGRTFQNLEDLNRQALEWSTVRMEQRPRARPDSSRPRPSSTNALTSPRCRPICPLPIRSTVAAPTNTAS